MYNNFIFGLITLCTTLFAASGAYAHPHVFMEANLEIFKNKDGEVSEIREVWRFDEIFSSSIILDFDKDGSGTIENNELKEIESIIKGNLKEFNYYTSIRYDNKAISIETPEVFFAAFEDGQMIVALAFQLKEPLDITNKKFAISISDPTYYVAVDIQSESSVVITGENNQSKQGCTFDIIRPNFDQFYVTNQKMLSDAFGEFDNPDLFLTDEFLTWVNFNCV